MHVTLTPLSQHERDEPFIDELESALLTTENTVNRVQCFHNGMSESVCIHYFHTAYVFKLSPSHPRSLPNLVKLAALRIEGSPVGKWAPGPHVPGVIARIRAFSRQLDVIENLAAAPSLCSSSLPYWPVICTRTHSTSDHLLLS